MKKDKYNVNDHGDEVGDEDVVSGVAEICSEGRWAELGNQHLIINCGHHEFWIMFTGRVLLLSFNMIACHGVWKKSGVTFLFYFTSMQSYCTSN